MTKQIGTKKSPAIEDTPEAPDRSIGPGPARLTWRSWFSWSAPTVRTVAGLALELAVLSIGIETLGLATAWPGRVAAAEPPSLTVFTITFFVIFLPLVSVVPVLITGGSHAMRTPVAPALDRALVGILGVAGGVLIPIGGTFRTALPFTISSAVTMVAAIAAIPVGARLARRQSRATS